jgi:tripartite-type tricarboxylate transporter receptor subunit TctC
MFTRQRKILLLSFLFLSGLFLGSGVGPVWAAYPDRSIRFIVAHAPGGQSDQMGRLLTRYANPYLGGRLYVENVLGASGARGWWECAKAAPDGYTISILSSGLLAAPNTIKDYPTYDLYDPICLVATESALVFTKWDGRFKTITDLISYAKAHPGEIKAGNAGTGSFTHLGMVGFEKAIGTNVIHVPYRGGGETNTATMGGHIDIHIETISSTASYVEGKKLRPLVILGPERLRKYPDVPTLKELGYDLSVVTCIGVITPKGIPKEVKSVLTGAFKKATEDEQYKKLMAQVGLESIFWGPEEADRFFKRIQEFYKKLANEIGLKPE